MSLSIYKSGQGYWTRTMSAIALSVLALMGISWLWGLLATVRIEGVETVYIQAGVSVVVLGAIAVIGYLLIAVKPKTVEFLIATEGEMKKVNWSNRREIMGSTWVVIGVTFFLALLCFVFDSAFQALFTACQVLKTSAG